MIQFQMKIKKLKLKNKKEHFQKRVCLSFFSFFFLFTLNNQLGKNEMETIINDKTTENICQKSSSNKQETNRSNTKEKRSISDPRRSIKGYSSPIHLKKKSHRRSTVVCLPLTNENNEILLNIPSRQRSNSDQSIILVKDNSSYPIDQAAKEYFYYPNSNSDDDEKSFLPGTTRIKLSLPLSSPSKITHRHQINNQNSNVAEEFTLPTNPPITVTIEPHNHLNDRIEKDNSIHDDQICSPENIHRNQQRISLDPSLKNTSTIVNYFMDLLKPSDNKLAMKLFGSKKGVLKERIRQQRAGHCIIHPCSNFR